MMPVVGREPEIEYPCGNQDPRWCEERSTPTEPRRERRTDAGSKRDTEISTHAIESKRAPSRIRCLDQHRHADRMIDRRKHAEREHRRAERREIWCDARAG